MLVKKKKDRSRKNISRIWLETLGKSQINLQKKIIYSQQGHQIRTVYWGRTWLDTEKNKKQKSYRPSQNISWSMEDKKIWWHTSSIMQHCLLTKHNRQIEKSLHLPFPNKDDLGNTKNYWGIILTALVAKVFNVSQLYLNRNRENS